MPVFLSPCDLIGPVGAGRRAGDGGRLPALPPPLLIEQAHTTPPRATVHPGLLRHLVHLEGRLDVQGIQGFG